MKYDPSDKISCTGVARGTFGSYSHNGKFGLKTLEYHPPFASREDAEREATIGMLARDISPSLVHSHGWKDQGNYAEIEMDHAGEKLETYLKRYQPTTPGKMRIVAEMAHAIAGLHDYGIAHLDLTPRNVFVERMENGVRVRVGDFGTSGVKDEVKARKKVPGILLEKLTLDTLSHYSPDWGAPEQAHGEASCASDCYSLAHVAAYIFRGGSEDIRNTEYFDAAHRQLLMHAAHLPASKGIAYFTAVEDLFKRLYCSLREPMLRPHALEIANQTKKVESLLN